MSEIHSASDIISNLFGSIEKSTFDAANTVVSTWKTIMLSIKGNGENGSMTGQNLADHTRVIDLKNGNLLIETDHPGWIQILKLHNRYILTGLKKRCPTLNIRIISYRLKGSSASFAGTGNSMEREKVAEVLDRRYKSIEEYDKTYYVSDHKHRSPEEVPEAIRKIFENFGK